jgi:hypothetical protein
MVSMRMSEFDHWTWETGSAHERGVMVRQHVTALRANIRSLGDLFLLTDNGVEKILQGDDWRPEYDRPSINYI